MTKDYRKRAENFLGLVCKDHFEYEEKLDILISLFRATELDAAQEARRQENEACWNLAMGATGDTNNVAFAEGYSGSCRDIAKAIRSRMEEK